LIVSSAVTAKWHKGTGGFSGDESQNLVAAPLSHGSNPNSNAAGRRREDDENLVTSFDAEMSYNGTSDYAYLTRKLRRAVQYGSSVRRLTPTECCRLQGFPDDWLGPPNEPPDSPRYAALGDAVTVPVAEWIGRRILEAAA
jgi:DNA (cytosine-5)-methyltransferase 1